MYIKFLAHCFLTIVINVFWISFSKYQGGEVGMVPFQVVIIVIPLFIISSIITFFNSKYFFLPNVYLIIIHLILFELLFLFFQDKIPITQITSPSLTGFLSRSYTFSSLISAVIVFFGSMLLKKN